MLIWLWAPFHWIFNLPWTSGSSGPHFLASSVIIWSTEWFFWLRHYKWNKSILQGVISLFGLTPLRPLSLGVIILYKSDLKCKVMLNSGPSRPRLKYAAMQICTHWFFFHGGSIHQGLLYFPGGFFPREWLSSGAFFLEGDFPGAISRGVIVSGAIVRMPPAFK